MDKKTVGGVVLIAAIIVVAVLFFGNKPTQTNTNNNNKAPGAVSVNPCADSTSKDIVMTAKSKDGNYLADSKCMTLYVSSQDKNGESNCNDDCAKTWLPFAYDGKDLKASTNPLAKNLNVIKRKDGTQQYAYGNTPLYYYKDDKVAGDMKGNGVNKVWSVIYLDKQATK